MVSIPIRKLKEKIALIKKEFNDYFDNSNSNQRENSQMAIGLIIDSMREYEVVQGEYYDRIVCVLPKTAAIVVLKLHYITGPEGKHSVFCMLLTPGMGANICTLGTEDLNTHITEDGYHSGTDATHAQSSSDGEMI